MLRVRKKKKRVDVVGCGGGRGEKTYGNRRTDLTKRRGMCGGQRTSQTRRKSAVIH